MTEHVQPDLFGGEVPLRSVNRMTEIANNARTKDILTINFYVEASADLDLKVDEIDPDRTADLHSAKDIVELLKTQYTSVEDLVRDYCIDMGYGIDVAVTNQTTGERSRASWATY